MPPPQARRTNGITIHAKVIQHRHAGSAAMSKHGVHQKNTFSQGYSSRLICFFPRIFLLQWVSHSLDGFYTGPSPDVLWRTVFILASLQICKIQKRWLRQAAGGWRWVRGFRQKLAHGGGVAVNVGVCRQVQIQQGSREGLHGRLAEHRAPARNQSIGHGTLENGRSLSGFGLCQKSNEGGCFLAPPAADFNAQDDPLAAP